MADIQPKCSNAYICISTQQVPASQGSAFPTQGLRGGPLPPQKVMEGLSGQVVYEG